MNVDVDILDAGDRRAAGGIWRWLQERWPPPLACTWEWTSTWLDHYGDDVPHRFLVGYRAGPCGIALITSDARRRGPFPLRRLHLGTAGEPPGTSVFTERNGLLCDPAARDAFGEAAIAALRAERGWHELHLDGFALKHAAPLLAADPNFTIKRERCRFIELDRLSDPVDRLRTSVRRRVRQSLRAFGPLEQRAAASTAEALDMFAELRELHQAKWMARGEGGAFSSSRFTAFHRALIARLGPERALLFRVRSARETVGCLLVFVDGEDALFYQGGFGSFEDNKRRAGLVTHALCARHCAQLGLRRYDLLAGEARYKDELGPSQRELIWARRPRGRAVVLGGELVGAG